MEFRLQRAFKALCQSTHLYGRRLVLEWATTEESIEDIRKRTAEEFSAGNNELYYLIFIMFITLFLSAVVRV